MLWEMPAMWGWEWSGGHLESIIAMTAGLPKPFLVGKCVCFQHAEGGEKRREPSQPLKPTLGFTAGAGRITKEKLGL